MHIRTGGDTSDDGNTTGEDSAGSGAPRTVDGRSRDPHSPHSLPVSTVQALIDQWRAEAARIDSFHATMGSGWHACADQLAALLASPSLHRQEQEEDLSRGRTGS